LLFDHCTGQIVGVGHGVVLCRIEDRSARSVGHSIRRLFARRHTS